jgi:Fe-S cluster assembly protein SufD
MTTTFPITNTTERFLREFEVLQYQFQEQNPEWLFQIRTQAIERLQQLGIPTRKNEFWKYTSLDKIFNTEYSHNLHSSDAAVSSKQLDVFQIQGLEAIRITTYNGRFVSSLSDTDQLPKGVVVCSFSKACESHADLVRKYFSSIAPFNKEAMVALNTVFTLDGLFIYIPKNIVIEKPIYIQHLIDSKENVYYFQRNLFILEGRSQATIIEAYQSSSVGIWNEVNEIVVGQEAQLTYHKIQNNLPSLTQLSHTAISQDAKSLVNTGTYTMNCKWIRNMLHFSLDAEHTETHLNGLYLTKENEFVDTHSLVDHRMPNCYSNELYKGIMNDHSTAVFNGKVFVHRDAQKTNAYQSNKNIVLTNTATVYTKPELEIYADDVKCSHGATTGQLDQQALFYLRARGISEENAKILLLNAFMGDVLNTIKIDALRKHIERAAPSNSPKGGVESLD